MNFALGLLYLGLFGGIAGGGAYIAVTSAVNAVRGISSKSWPTAEGTITSATIDYHPGSQGSGEYLGEAESYEIKVKYEYQVNGISYEAGRLRFGLRMFKETDVFWSSRVAQKQISEYRGGKRVKVYYHPQKPEISALQPGLKLVSVGFFVFGLVVFASGCVALVFSLRSLAS